MLNIDFGDAPIFKCSCKNLALVPYSYGSIFSQILTSIMVLHLMSENCPPLGHYRGQACCTP